MVADLANAKINRLLQLVCDSLNIALASHSHDLPSSDRGPNPWPELCAIAGSRLRDYVTIT